MLSYCCSSSDFLQSHYTVFFSLFHAPLDVVVHFLVFLRFFRLKSFFLSSLLLSHRSRISAVIQVFFLLRMFAKDLTGWFSHCCVEGGDHWIYFCIFVAHDGERCKPPAYHSLEGFQHLGIFQRFEVQLESCVFWFADFFQAKAECHHQQIVITFNVCSWKTSCSGNVHSCSKALPH